MLTRRGRRSGAATEGGYAGRMESAATVTLASVTQVGSDAWLAIGWVALGIAFACALAILWDIFGRGYQHMRIMDAAWPVNVWLIKRGIKEKM